MEKPDFEKMAFDFLYPLHVKGTDKVEGVVECVAYDLMHQFEAVFNAGLERAASMLDAEASRLARLPVHASHAGGRKAALSIATAIRSEIGNHPA